MEISAHRCRAKFSSDYSYYRHIILSTEKGEDFINLVEGGYGLGSFQELKLSINQVKHKKSIEQGKTRPRKGRRRK
jgi:hypothetical protein